MSRTKAEQARHKQRREWMKSTVAFLLSESCCESHVAWYVQSTSHKGAPHAWEKLSTSWMNREGTTSTKVQSHTEIEKRMSGLSYMYMHMTSSIECKCMCNGQVQQNRSCMQGTCVPSLDRFNVCHGVCVTCIVHEYMCTKFHLRNNVSVLYVYVHNVLKTNTVNRSI